MTPNPFNVRRAVPADADALFAFLMEHYYRESALQPVSEKKVRANIRRCVEMDRGIAGVIDGEDGIEASIGLAFEEYNYTDESHVEGLWLGVHGDHRNTQHAPNLLKFAKWVWQGLDIPMFLEVLTADRLMGKMRLFQRQVPQIGAVFACGVGEGFYRQRRLGNGKGRPDL